MAGQAAITIHRNFKRVEPDLIRRLSGFPTGYFADIQGRRGGLDTGIRPMFPAAPVIGTAVTVKTVPDDNLAPYAALGILQPGDVLLIATGDWTGSAVIGDLITGYFRNAGAVAIVTDGAVRDVEGLEKVGLPIYARGLTASSPQKNGPGEVGGEISIGGVLVRSGDLVVADRDGVVILPQGRLSGAVDALQEVKAKEVAIEKDIAAGTAQPEWLKDFLTGDGVGWRD